MSYNPNKFLFIYYFLLSHSFVQPSIRSGYSSCDFSRVTSGRVSPSELPDSPCGSPPMTRKSPSPKGFLNKAVEARPSANVVKGAASTQTASATQKAVAADVNKAATLPNTTTTENILEDVFEDKVQNYNVEGTPAVISERNSLSDLTFSEDEDTKVKFIIHFL